jgi:hypothetical protein
MAMFLIAGSFRITGAQPDGDSIRFTPDDPANWDLITGSRVKRNASGAAQLRLDAIDALETHYGNPRTHQPLDLAHAAAAELLDWLGFNNVVRGQDETVTSSTPDTVAGYILTRSADLYGRCIAFVGRSAPPQDDGSSFFVDVDALRTTANHHLIKQGLAYRLTIGLCSPICVTSSLRWPGKPAMPDSVCGRATQPLQALASAGSRHSRTTS